MDEGILSEMTGIAEGMPGIVAQMTEIMYQG